MREEIQIKIFLYGLKIKNPQQYTGAFQCFIVVFE